VPDVVSTHSVSRADAAVVALTSAASQQGTTRGPKCVSREVCPLQTIHLRLPHHARQVLLFEPRRTQDHPARHAVELDEGKSCRELIVRRDRTERSRKFSRSSNPLPRATIARGTDISTP
jgi:hypothetical protein